MTGVMKHTDAADTSCPHQPRASTRGNARQPSDSSRANSTVSLHFTSIGELVTTCGSGQHRTAVSTICCGFAAPC